jgi:hypothetical protein
MFNQIAINFTINTDDDIKTYSEFVALYDEFSSYMSDLNNFDDFIIKKYDHPDIIYILKAYLNKTRKYMQNMHDISQKLSKYSKYSDKQMWINFISHLITI